ncbi:MAG: biotin--[acetyl-CoA-carboxylase] ligase [Cytophagales bacterium]|nr:biotin--[acetyl-CoA-carboxylase] ligase [Cytophagales bacterium]
MPTCRSTNDIAAELATHQGAAAHGTVVWTHLQTAGRGQRGNSWESSAGQNLTFSLVLYHDQLLSQELFVINQVVALALHDTITEILPQAEVWIKWPNDIWLNGGKVCGVLIENTLNQGRALRSIVGIGLNVNQLTFSATKATSLARVSGLSYSLEEVMKRFLSAFELRYALLSPQGRHQLAPAYQERLLGMGKPLRFRDAQGEIFIASVAGVKPDGHLLLLRHGQVVEFDIKELEWLLD